MTLQGGKLLGPDDPPAVEVLNGDNRHSVVLVCEHAGQAVPTQLGDLGLPPGAIDDHIGWDIGARAVAVQVAQRLGAPLVMQRYSRLVIDCNRPPEAPDAMPEISDGVMVPGNRNLGEADRTARVTEIFAPFHAKVTDLLDQYPCRATFAIHSFTPQMNGQGRPWDIGFLYRHDTDTSTRLQSIIQAMRPDLIIGMNQPYQIDDASDWFVPRHGEASGLAHSLIEIRNDHIRDATGQAAWADLLAAAITSFLKEA